MAVAQDVTNAYNALLKTTLDNYRGQLVDNIFNKFVLSWLLMEKQRVRMLSGGEQIVEHLLVGENSDTGNYAEWASVDITPQGGVEVAKFDWKQLVSTIAISGLEELKNNGKEAILSLLKARVLQSEKTLQKLVNDQLWGAVGGFTSILDIVDTTVAAGGSGVAVGEIDPDTAGNEYWVSQFKNLSAAATGNVTDAGEFAELQRELTSLYNLASDGNEAVSALISDRLTYEIYELGLTPNVRYEDTKSVNAGFTNLLFKGVPMYWDKAAPVGTVVGINPDTLTLVGHKDRWFKQSPFTASPIDGAGDGFGGAKWLDARYAVISTVGNLTVNDRRKNLKIVNFNQA